MEDFFDLQRKQFFKNRLRTMIRSIVRNKVRKERLVVVVAFHRFMRNCAMVGRVAYAGKSNLLKEFRGLGSDGPEAREILDQLRSRDSLDSSRVAAPLRPADDAVHIVTDGNEFSQTVDAVVEAIRAAERTAAGSSVERSRR